MIEIEIERVLQVGFPTLRACVDFFKEFEFLERDGKGSVEVAKPFLPSMFDSVLHSFNPDQPTTGFARNRYNFCWLLSRMVRNVSWFLDIIS